MILGVIPARYASTRFPGKPLILLNGKSMVQRVWEQVSKVARFDKVVIATDDERIRAHAQAFGAVVVMTRPDHPSGTDRCAEVATHFPEASYVVNIQGDEPFIQPEQIELLLDTLTCNKACQVATLAKKLEDAASIENPNIVKVVFSLNREALYFSRHPIPFLRNTPREEWHTLGAHYKHIGLYGFEAATLRQIAAFPPTALEQYESLEQLRWLENGIRIAIGITHLETVGIDTPEDVDKVVAFFSGQE